MKTVKDKVRGGEVFCVSRSTTVKEAARLLAEHGIGAVPVLDGKKLIGVFSERDLLARVVARDLEPARVKVEAVMTRKLVTASPEEGVEACLLKMQNAGCRHLPIVSGHELVGFVSIKDLLMLELKRRSREVRSLKMLMWAEDIPSQEVEETWQCGGCKRTFESELPPIHCPKCKAPRFQFTMVSPG